MSERITRRQFLPQLAARTAESALGFAVENPQLAAPVLAGSLLLLTARESRAAVINTSASAEKVLDFQSELAKKFPAHIDFTLKAIDKGTNVEGRFYKVSGKDNEEQFYLYRAKSNQVKHNGDPSTYEENTQVVARFDLKKNVDGSQEWVREELNQSSAIIYGNLESGDCREKCPDTFVVVEEVFANAAPIPGGEKDPIKIYDITPYVSCDRWGNWYDLPSPVIPPVAPTATPVPTVLPTPTAAPEVSCPPGTVKAAQSTETMLVCMPTAKPGKLGN